ncbi:MAG: hypothetical protein ABEK36_01725 [Candidatus Aenigmatarchaeota archaeon]
MSNFFSKEIVFVSLILFFLVFYVSYTFSGYGMFSFASPPDFAVLTEPDLNKYEPGQGVNLTVTFPFNKKKYSFFKPVLKSELKISTYLVNANSYLLFNNRKIDPSNIYEKKTGGGIKYKEIYFDLPVKKVNQIYLHIEGTIPQIKGKEIYLVHNVQRNHYLFKIEDLYLGSVKRMVKNE